MATKKVTMKYFFTVFALFLLAATLPGGAYAQRETQSVTKQEQDRYTKVLKENLNTIQFIENKGQWSSDVTSVGFTNIGNMVVKKDHLYFVSTKRGEHHEEEGEEEEEEEEEMKEAHSWGIFFEGGNLTNNVVKKSPFQTKFNYFIDTKPENWASDVSAYGEMDLKEVYKGIDLRMYSQDNNTLEFDWIVNPGADFRQIKMKFKGQDGLRVDEKGHLAVKLRFDEVKFDIPESYQIIEGKKVPVTMTFKVEGDVAVFETKDRVNPSYPLVIDPSLKWGVFFDCNTNDFDEYLFAVQVDNTGNVYCGGKINVQISNTYIASSVFGYSATYTSGQDGILYKINPMGTAVLAITYYGGTGGNDGIYGLGLSPDNSVIYACGFAAVDIPMGGTLATAFDNARSSQDGYVASFNTSTLGTLRYATYIGSSGGSEEMVSIRGLSNTSFVVGGLVTSALSTSGPNYITSAYDAIHSGSNEMYIAKFTNHNTLTFGTYVGGDGSDILNDLQVFSDGAIVFSGSTASSTASFPSLVNGAGTGTTGLDGVVGVIPSAGGTFSMLSRIGGSSNDEFYGLAIGPFDTLYLTGITSSSDFPLGTGASAATRYDVSSNGSQDAFIGKLPRTGKPGATDTWLATYFGGSGNDRGNTLRTYTPYAAMVFGETQSNNFPVQNLSDGGTLYDDSYNSGWDIYWFVLGTDLKTLYFSTYVGGSANDYLGQTGTPHGSNHFVVEGDSLITLGTTVHSPTLQPTVVGPATGPNAVFDASRASDTDNDDVHLVFKWRIGGNLLNFDYGDAPLSYGTPNHYIFSSLKLGANIDKDDFHPPVPGSKANYDDANGTTPDDEDALSGTQVMLQDSATSFSRTFNITNTTGGNATVMGWIDFNGNGVFDNSEVDTARVANGATTATLTWTGFTVNFSADDTTYLRLRISADAAFNVATPSPTANANNGEVEDYMVIIYHCVNLTPAVVSFQNPTACATANGSITISNSNLLPSVQYGVYYRRNGGALQGPFYLTTQNNGTLVIPSLLAGTYTAVQVFHPTNPLCGDTLDNPVTLIDPSTPAPTNVTATPSTVCTGNSFTLSATGTALAWTGPNGFTGTGSPITRTNATLAMAGTYSVTQTVSGCTSPAATVTVTVNSTPTISSTSSSNPTTCGGTNGSITLNGLNNSTTYSVTYTRNSVGVGPVGIATNGTGQLVLTGLNAGTYANIIVTLNGCPSSAVGPFILTDPATPSAPTNVTASPNPICTGNTLTLSATGSNLAWTGPPSNTYTATGSPVTRSITNTNQGGIYSVTQTVNGCTSPAATVSVTVNQTPSIASTSTSNPTTCSGTNGSITLNGLNNSTTYSVTYTRNASSVGPVNITTTGSGQLVIANLNAATYANIIVTLNGCPSSAVGPFTLTDPATPSAPTNVTASPNPICTGNTLTLSATGSNLSWTGPSGYTASGSPVTRSITAVGQGGTYSVTQTVAGCTSPAATVDVTVNPTPSISTTSSSNPTTCSGTNGTITLNGLTGSTTYSVTYNKNGNPVGPVSIASSVGGTLVITGLTAGTYTNVIVTLAGCPSSAVGPFTLTDPSTPSAPTNVTASPNPICTGNTLTLSATGSNLAWTGPDSYTASGSPVTRSITATTQGGIYSVTQTVNGCTSPAATISVTVNATPNISSTSTTNPTTCSGTNGSITLNGLVAASTYSVTYSKNGVGQGPVSIPANGTGQVIISNLTAGSYTNIIVTLAGCPSSPVAGPLTLTDPSTPSAPSNVTASPNPICTGNTLTLSATGTNLSWTGPDSYTATGSPVTRSITVTTQGGTYSVTQTVANCVSPPATVLVTVNTTPSISSTTTSNPTTCGGSNGSITLNGLTPSATYSVTYDKNSVAQGPVSIVANGTGQVVISGLTAGSYSNFVVTINGCPSNPLVGTLILTDPTTPAAPTNVTASPNPICTGNTVTLSATGTNLSWTGPDSYAATGSPVTRLITATTMGGTYSVTQTVNNCVSPPATVTVTVSPTPVITSTSSTNPTTCGGTQGTITLNGLNNSTFYSVSYNKNAVPSTPVSIQTNGSGQLIITGLTAGTYSNIIVVLAGCPSAAAGPITLSDPSNPTPPTVSNSGPACYGDTLRVFASSVANATYAWTGPGGYTSTSQNPVRVNATPAMSGSYTVVVTVNNCNSSPVSTTATITSCPPVAVNDNYTINEDQTLNVPAQGVKSNDYDPANPQQPLTVNSTPVTNPLHGTLSLNSDGSFTYIPTPNYNGLDSFSYSVCDNEVPAACDTATVYITVLPVNDPPVINDSTVTTPEDVPVTVCLPISDIETATQTHSVTLCGTPANGTLSSLGVNNGTNPHTVCFTYTPNANFNGTNTVCLIVCDNGTPQGCDTATVTINVTPVNDPPVANNDTYNTNEDTPLNVSAPGVLTNDSDPIDGTVVTVVGVVSGPTNGTLTLNANGSFTYTPNANFTGTDGFCYSITDAGTPAPFLLDTACVTINVVPVNDPPVINDSTVTTPEDVPITVCLPITDIETATQLHSVTLCGAPADGTLSGTLGVNNGTNPHTVCFTYTPNANFNGTNTVCLIVCDNGSPQGCDTATVTINVTPVNDPPVAVDDYYTNCTGSNITGNVMTNDSDVDGPFVTVLGTLSGPVTGTLSINGTGAFTYTPSSPSFNSLDSFVYVICDGGTPNLCDTAKVTLDYTCVNVPPIANNDNYTTNEDQTLVISVPGVMSNDNDPDGGTITVTTPQLTGTNHGTLTLNANGSFTYVPNPNYNGADTFQYSICDNGTPVKCDTAYVFITVLPVNDPPTVPDTTTTVCEDCGPVTVCVPISDIETNQDYYVAGLVCGPNSGTYSTSVNNVSNTLCVTYTSNTNFNGTDSMCVVLCDNGTPNLCDTSVVTIIVTPVNDPPIANNDSYTTNEDTPLNVSAPGVLSNDSDPADGTVVTVVQVVNQPTNGTVTVNANGSFTYTPNANYIGTDVFCYSITDAGTPAPFLLDTACVTITVAPVNDPPQIPDTTVTTCEDCPITVCVPFTDNDVTDVHGYVTLCNPTNGTLSSVTISDINDVLCFTYTGTTNFNGTDSVCFVVCDNGVPTQCDTSTITIIVTPVNDPPVALNDFYTTNEDSPLSVGVGTGVRANDNDNADGNPVSSLTVTTTPLTGPNHGTLTLASTGSFVYTPDANYVGTDSFQYVVCDAGTPPPSLCDTATAYITIVPVNDPPYVPDTTVTTPEDTPITVCLPITDVETSSQVHVAFVCDNPNSGTITTPSVNLAANPHTVCVTYSPGLNFNGTDSFCVIVCDNGNPILCDTSVVTIVVTPVNDPPIANNDSYSTNEDTPLNVSAPGVQSNDSDPDGTTLTSTIVTGTSNGTVTLNANGSFTYTPNANYTGTDTFVYSLCDAGIPLPALCDTAVVIITVNSQNDPPVVPDTTVTTPEDTPITVCIPISDGDLGQQYIASICGNPANGLITAGPVVNNGSIPPTVCITYSPGANFNGTDSICLTVCDNGIPFLCDNSTIKIIVTPVNDPPVANNDTYSTNEDTPLNVSTPGVLNNDNDPDGTTLTATVVSTTTNGTLTLNGNGSFTYVPNTNYNGTDTFFYSACDAGIPLPSLCDTAMVVITVNPVNDPPYVPDTTVTTCEDCPITVCLPISDNDTLDIHSYTTLCPGQNGTVSNVTINQTTNVLCFSYQSYLNLNGSDTVCFIVCDNGTPQQCDTTTTTIIITPVNDPPYADTIYVVTYENQPVGVNVASATGDPEGNPLSYSYGGVTPNNGTYGITGNGAIVVLPNTGFTGTFTIPYSVCDLSPYQVNVLCDSAAIVVTVLPAGDTLINHSPVASNDYVTTPLNTPVVVNELANDYDPDGDALQVTVTCTPDNGNYTVNPNGTINYFPNTGFFGYDTICYTICDPTAANNPKPLCDNAIVVIYVSKDSSSFDNDPPVAVDDFAHICADANATLNLLLNDNDPNGDAITSVTIIDNVDNGVLSNAGLGFYVYTPNGSSALNDTLLYQICDNGTPSLCDTGMAVIFINATPIITPSAGSAVLCSNDSLNLTFTSSVQGTTITWTATNGTSGTGDIHTVLTNNTSVDQTVTYTISGSTGFGCGSSSITVPVTVKPRPNINYSANGSIFCSGGQVVINANSNIAGTTYTWSGTNGTSGTGSLVTDNPVNNGTSNITVTYSIVPTFNGCLGDTLNVSVTVKPQPSLSVAPTTQTVCSGTPISIAITPSISGTSVNWTGSNGNSGNSLTINDSPFNLGTNNITVTYTVNGTYNGCPANTVTATVVVRPRVVADAGADKSVVGCSASCVTLGGSPTGSGGSGTLTYVWTPSTGLNDTSLANPTACGLFANTTYTVVVTDGAGCFGTDQVTITSSPNPLAAEAGSGGALCLGSGDSVTLGGFPTAVGGLAPYTYTWAPLTGLNTTNAANPEAFPTTTTKYFVTVTDQNGCQSVDSTVVTVYPTLIANAGADTTVCSGLPFSLGGAPTASGGSGSGYSYTWSPSVGVSNISASNPQAVATSTTTYSVTVTDGNGCSATDNIVVTVNQAPTAYAGPDKSLSVCPGDSVILGDNPAAVGGTPAYTYTWTPSFGLSDTSVANPVLKGLSATQTYTLLVTDANGCASTDNVTVNVTPNNLQVNAGATREICFGNCSQLGVFPTVVGGTPPYIYDWNNGGLMNDSTAANPVACPTANTSFTLVVTDSKGCSATSTVSVIVNANPIASAGPDTSVCAGSTVGIGGSPAATSGNAPYSYSWNPVIGLSLPNVPNPTAAPAAVTTYQLVVTDSKGCAGVDEVTVTPRSNPVVDAGNDKSLVACVGDTTFIGGIPAVVSGGSSPFTYHWSPSTGLSDTAAQNPLVTGITSTTSYQLLVTDAYGCQGVDYAIVNLVPSTLQAEAGNSGVVCAAANTPVQIGGNPTAAGGTAPYTYSWSNGTQLSDSTAPNPTATVSSTTTFYVTVTDSKGCVAIDSVTVKQNVSPVANAGADTTICSGFGVTLGGSSTATSGTAPYQYSWTPTTGLNNNNSANPLAIPQVTTVYVVVVTDSNGCQASDAITVTVRPNPTADAGPDRTITACAGDSIRIGGSPSATGGAGDYTYVWGPSAGLTDTSIANPYVSGITSSQLYSLTVTDANGCTATDAVVVAVVPSSLTAEAGNGGSICFGSGTNVQLGGTPTAVGGVAPFVYTWSNSLAAIANPTVSPAATTTYYLTITDAKGCQAFDSVTVTVNQLPVACAGADTAVCQASKVRLGCVPSATGGTSPYSYLWSNGSTASNPVVGPTVTTIYTLTVTDANGCTATDNMTVTVNTKPTADAGPDKTLVACSQDSVQLGGSPAASGGSAPYVFSWAPSGGLTDDSIANPYAKNLGSSVTYTLSVVDQNGCSASDQVLVNVTNSSMVAEAGNNVTFCQGASVNVTLGGSPTVVGGTAPFTYSWTPATSLSSTSIANPVATPTQTTTYTVVVVDANGCIAQDTVRITINPRPQVSAGLNDTICAGSCVTLGGAPTASGGSGSTYTYNWGPAFFFSTATNIANPVVCPTGNITYAVTVTDSLGCSNTASVSIKVNQNPVANAGADKATVHCENACVQIGGTPTATGGTAPYLYAWSPSTSMNNTGLPNPTICNLAGLTFYTVTVTDVNGCTSTDQVVVNSSPSNLTANAGVDKTICAGGSNCITIGGNPTVGGGTGPFNITWSPLAGICTSNTVANPEVNPNDTTTYVVLVQDAQGCIAVDSMVVTANPAVTASVGADTSICTGGAALLGGNPTGSGGTAPFTYLWSPAGGLSSITSSNPTASPSVITAYCVTVTDAVGCTASTCQRVSVDPAVIANAGSDQTITNCSGSFAQIGGSPTGTGGSGNYSYAWSPTAVGNTTVVSGATTPNPFITNLTTTTTFTVTVTDNVTGCYGTDQVTIFVNQTNLAADAGADKLYCSNSVAGVLIGGNPTATGGQSPYTYQWSPITGLIGPNAGNIANPVAAPAVTTTYTVTVTDNLGCNKVDSMTVIVGPLMVANAGKDTAICYNTSVVLGGLPPVVGGVAPYTYSWTPSQFLSSTTDAHPTAQNVIFNTTYTLTVRDSLQCSATDIVVVTTRSLPTAQAGPNVSIFACSGDSAVLGGSPTASGTQGPYTYSWYPPLDTSLSSLTAANPVVSNLGFTTQFTVTVTDTFGCQNYDDVVVTVLPNTVFVEAGTNVPSLCSNVGNCVTLGGSPSASGGTPGYVYHWFGNVSDTAVANPQACPLTTTTYTLVVTDSKGCQAFDSVTVLVNQPTEASISGLNPQYCVNNPNVVMTGTPAGGTFSGPGVTGNVFQPSAVGVGFWCIKYTYTNQLTGCVDDTTICVTVNPQPVVNVTGYNASYCVYEAPDTLYGTPASGTFSGPGMVGNVFNPSLANIGNNVITYSYTDSASTGCSNSVQFTIVVKPAPTIGIAANDDSACANQTVVISPNYSIDVTNIQWSVLGGGTFASGLNPVSVVPTGVDYGVVATAISNNTGCIARDTVVIHVNQNPIAVDDNSSTCEDESVSVSVTTNDSDPEGDANVVTVISSPNGSTTVTGGVVNFTPAANFNGSTTVVYSICNAQCLNQCDTATVQIFVTPKNDVPVAAVEFDTIYQNGTSTVCPVVSDVDGDPLTVTIVPTGNVNGTVTVANNCITFVPTQGWIGTQVITYQVCDQFEATQCDGQQVSTCDTSTVTITVLPANHPPFTVKVNSTVCINTPIGINIGAGSSDPDGDPLTFSYGSISGPTGSASAVTVTGSGAIVFVGNTPGYYTFSYYVCDQSNLPVFSLCDTNVVVVHVIACDSSNTPPVATDDAVVMTAGDTININELANDYDADGDPLNVTIISGPSLPGATAGLNPDGTVTYTSPTVGVDSITYVICDPYNACDTAVIYIFVDSTQHNHPPIAVDDYTITGYKIPVGVSVIINDIDPDGDTFTVTSLPCPPSYGTAVISGNTVIYTPGPNANALNPDTFCYVICDNGNPSLCDTATVVVVIENSVVAVNDTTLTGPYHPVTVDVTDNDFDPEGDSFSVISVITSGTVGTVTQNPDGTITFVPNTDTCGFTDQFQYVIQDTLGALDTATVYIIIDCCPRPDAIDDNVLVLPGDQISVNPILNDQANGLPVTGEIVSGPFHGSAVFTTDSLITYTANASYCGFDTIFYSIESHCGLDTALVIVNVYCNQQPIANIDTVKACVNEVTNFSPLTNDVDSNGNQLIITGINPPFGVGAFSLNSNVISFTSIGVKGTFTMQYYVCDNGFPSLCDTGIVILQVVDCPQQVDTIYDTTFINTPVSPCIGAYVNSYTPLFITSICDPDNGSVTYQEGDTCFTYNPDQGFFGNDTFCITLCDSDGNNCVNTAVIITVLDSLIQAIDEPCDLDTTYINTPITLNVLENDILPWGGDTTVTVLGPVSNGTAVANADNTVTVTPNEWYQGTINFSYVVCVTTGPFSFCDTADVCVTVVDTNKYCFLPNGFSPNGDGVNDVYVIPCNEDNPEATLRVFNRWGVEIWRSEGHYKNDWDGTNMQGTKAPDGTYYAIYEYNDGTGKRQEQFIVIHR